MNFSKSPVGAVILNELDTALQFSSPSHSPESSMSFDVFLKKTQQLQLNASLDPHAIKCLADKKLSGVDFNSISLEYDLAVNPPEIENDQQNQQPSFKVGM